MIRVVAITKLQISALGDIWQARMVVFVLIPSDAK